VAQFGRVVMRRGYGNQQTLANKWQEALVRMAFTPCLQYQYASGKNTSDIALALDAQEALFDERADTFCLVTSDSDFAYLCRKLRERGATVLIVGEAKTPDALQSASDQYFMWHAPEPPEPAEAPGADANRRNTMGLNGQAITNVAGPFAQGWEQGALRMNRGEGMWYHEGKIYVMDTSGGPVSEGTIWELDVATQVMTCIYASANTLSGNNGDNITVSPRGHIVICEDGGTVNDAFGPGTRMMGLTPDGGTFIFCKNNVNLTSAQLAAVGKATSLAGNNRSSEFCGACFDPTGRYLFVNIQTPGITFAITGPWANGTI